MKRARHNSQDSNSSSNNTSVQHEVRDGLSRLFNFTAEAKSELNGKITKLKNLCKKWELHKDKIADFNRRFKNIKSEKRQLFRDVVSYDVSGIGVFSMLLITAFVLDLIATKPAIEFAVGIMAEDYMPGSLISFMPFVFTSVILMLYFGAHVLDQS